MRSLPIYLCWYVLNMATKKTKVTISSRLVLDNIYQSLTQSRYSHNNHYDHKMTQKPINVLTNDNPKKSHSPTENNQTARFISLISKYSRTHTSYYDECFELEFPLDLWHYLIGCKKQGHLKSLKVLFQPDLVAWIGYWGSWS
jgi:hypothetical protein